MSCVAAYLWEASPLTEVQSQSVAGDNTYSFSGLDAGKDYLLQFIEPRAVAENTMRRGFAPGL